MQRGRPSLYSRELADEICARLADGESLRRICERDGMPSDCTVRTWAIEDREGFYSHYTRAREIQALRWAEEVLEIADDARNEDYQRARLRVDSRKWLLSKVLPKVYGDKLQHTGDGGGAVTLNLITGVDRAQPDD